MKEQVMRTPEDIAFDAAFEALQDQIRVTDAAEQACIEKLMQLNADMEKTNQEMRNLIPLI